MNCAFCDMPLDDTVLERVPFMEGVNDENVYYESRKVDCPNCNGCNIVTSYYDLIHREDRVEPKGGESCL